MSCAVRPFTRESFGICHLRGSCSKEIELDLIYDIPHLFARLRTDGIKATSSGFSGGKQGLKSANTRNRGRVCLFYKRKWGTFHREDANGKLLQVICESVHYFGGVWRRSKGFATLRNVSKVTFFWQYWARKLCRFSVLFGYLTKWEPNYFAIFWDHFDFFDLFFNFFVEERIFFLVFPGFEPTQLCDPSDQRRL